MKTLLALEPRILFDGAALTTGAEVVQDQTSQDQSIPSPDAGAETNSSSNMATDSDDLWASGLSLATPSDRREIVFIDTRVEEYQTLMEGINPAAEVILLDARRDGIEQIAEILRERTDIDAIHLIAEGNEAELHLGTTFLTQETISGKYADLLAQIGQSLSAEADLLIYGCNFGRGQAGLSAIQTLAELTGADIAASTDRTGHVSEYANWELEVSTGFIETSIVIGEATQEAWEGVLATYTVTTTTDGGAGSLRQAIINANANAGTDTITFVGSGTYLLTIAGTGEDAAATGDLDITDNLIIIGNGAGNTVIDASGFGVDGVIHLLGTNTATISGVTIQGGTANDGGGIFVDGSSILNLTDAIVQNNTSDLGGGLHVHGTANVNRVLFFNNSSTVEGGAIHFHGADGGSLTNITVTGNTSGIDGGGLWTDTSITITNSTFTLNHANNDGGGIVADAGNITISNTIVSDNTATTANPDVDGNFSSNGFNLIKDITGGTGFGSDISGVSANLGGLADNGGPTRTHALLAGSPALNAGTTSGAPAVDQRGITRDAVPDIGAFEYTASPFVSKSEFMVNDPSGNNEVTSGLVRGAERAVDIAPNGDYVVVWTNGTSNDKVFAKVLDSAGNEKVAQFQVNSGGGTNAWTDVAVDDSGNFLVTWTQGGDIFMRRFLANGTAVDAGDVIVNTGTSNTQQNPSVNMNGAGDFVIAWEGDGGGNEGIFVRRGSMGGGLTGSDITVNTAAAAQDPSVGIADSGDFVVVWDNGSDAFFQLYNSAGALQSSGQVDGGSQLNAGGAAVEMSGDGRFTVAYRATDLNVDVYVRQYDASGNPLFQPQLANSSILGTQTSPSITMDDIGEFIVVWEGAGDRPGQNDTAGIFGQKFNSSGQKIGVEFLINQTTANVQDRASVAMLDRDNFVAVWTGSDGAQTDIFARQYGATTAPTLDLDANDSSGATGNDYAFTFTEGDGPTAIADSDTDLADVDSTTFAYVTVSLSGLLDGNAEVLILDGDTFALATDAPGHDTTGGNYHVRVSTAAGTAIVTIIKQGGGTFSEVETETLIKAIQYQHTDTSAPTDGDRLIEVKVNDGTTDSAAARTTINVNPVNDAPSVATNTGITVNEASTGNVLTTAMLNEGDPDDAGTGLTYTVTAVTTNGTLRLSGTALGLNDTFTQDDIDTNRVTYDHNGSETTTDSFSFSLADGGEDGAVPATGVFTLTITPVNDAPSVATNTGITVNEASTGNVLTTAMLNEGDPDDAGTGLTYTVTAVTTNGTLRLSGTALGLNDTFTQDDIDTNRVTYDHNGSETTTDSFGFSLADGGEDGAVPATGVFTLTITPVNDAPSVATNTGTTVNEASTANVLTTAMLNEGDPDDAGTGLTYTVTAVTTNGILRLSGTALGLNDTFTQDDIDTHRVTYDHNGSETTTDSFGFSLADGGEDGAVPATGVFTLTITPTNDPPVFNGLDNAPTYTEGGAAVVLDNNVTISDTELDAANNYNGATLTLIRNGGGNAEDLFNGSGTLLPLVESGNLMVGITTIGTVTTNSGGTLLLTFNNNATTALVNSALQQLTYANSSVAPPASVQIDYMFSDGNGGSQGTGGALNDTGFVTVSIIAINNSPIAIPDNFVVNEGSSTTLNLAGNDLDLDDGLDLTSITIVSGPTNGTITSVNANGTVEYTHDGSETLMDSFTYTIRDLAGAISNTVTVSLTVTPVNDAPIITSNGGGANANISVITGTTGVTDVDASDAEGDLLTYSIIGGADAALFRIDPTTGVLTFITAPDFQTPGDVGGDNIYDVIVQASDGTAVDTQAIAVTVTQANVPPQIFIPPPTDPPPSSEPPPRDAGEDTSEDQAPGNGGSLDPGSPGNFPDGGPGLSTNGFRDTDQGNNLEKEDLPAKQQEEKPTGIVEMVNDMLGFLQKPFDMTVFKDEIRSLLTRHGFIQDLDRVRDNVQDIAATEKTYLASSIAVSTGLSIGYVVWLLRSGVLLTALLSSVPAWQFVNPLLVLDAAAKKKRQSGQKGVEGDSVESLFEKPTASAEITKGTTGGSAKAPRVRWFNWTKR